MRRDCLALLLCGAAFLAMLPVARAQEANLLDTVRRNEQREAAARRPRRPPPAADFLRLPENNPADYGARPSTRPQFVRGLRGLQKRPNTATPPRRPLTPQALPTLPPDPVVSALPRQTPVTTSGASGPSFTNVREVNPNVAGDAPGLPPIAAPLRLRRSEPDPYAPDGLRLGNLAVLPYVGVSGGYDSNPLQSAGRVKGSSFVQGEAGLNLQSDWSRHSISADLRGLYSEYQDAPNASRPDVAARIGGRYDVGRDTAFDLEGRLRISTETVSDINLPIGVQQRPNTYSYGGSAGVTQQFSRISVNLRGSVDRNTYDAASLGTTVIDQTDRNQNVYALRLRVGYEVNPGLIPFVDAIVDTRQYDTTVDRGGFRRNSNGVTGRAGATLNFTGSLSGEVAAGITNRQFDDPRLRELTSPAVEATLLWSISPLTALRVRASTEVNDTVSAFSSGIFDRRIGADIEHALFRNLTLGATAQYDQQESQGTRLTQDTYLAGVRADYKIGKDIVLRGSYTFTKLNSSFPGGGYSDHVMLLGIRLQR